MRKLIILFSIVISFLVSCKKEVYYEITTMVQPEGAGSIILTPNSSIFLEGSSVKIQVNPNGDYQFTGWSGSLSGTENPKSITVSSNLNIVANFALKTYPLTLSVEGEGTINEQIISTKADYSSGTVVELTAKPGEQWLFDHWEGDLDGNLNPIQITVSSSKSVKAVFVKKMYDLNVTVEGEGAVNERVIQVKSESYQAGTHVELTANPSEHWLFDHWDGDLSGSDNPVQVSVDSSMSVKAVFISKDYFLTIEVKGKGTVEEKVIETKGLYQEGSTVELTAKPDEFWVFDHWEGAVEGIDNPIIFSVTEESLVMAVFVENDPGIVYTETEYISAYEINRRMGMGINVGAQLDAYYEENGEYFADEEVWGNKKVTQDYFNKLAQVGYKSVRIPVTWLGTYGPAPDYKIDEGRLNRVAEVVDYALSAGLYAIINMHHDGLGYFWLDFKKAAVDSDYNRKVNEQLAAMWTQIARKFRDKDEHLIFESFNEPGQDGIFSAWPSEAEKKALQAEYNCLNEWNQTFVDAVRKTGGNNAKRWLIVVAGGATERNFDQFRIPHDYVSNNRIMLSLHFYEPASYAFGYCEEWGHTSKIYDEEASRFDEHFIENEFIKYREQYLERNIPLCIDELGCFNRETERGKAFQLYYLEYLVRAATINGFATFIWDDGGRKDIIRGEFLFWHDTGEYVGYSEEIVNILREASYSTEPNYTLQSIYDRAPYYDPTDEAPLPIEDAIFKSYLVSNFDLDGDGEICMKEARRINSISILTTNVRSLQGIEYCENLVELRCQGSWDWWDVDIEPGLLTSLDVSHNTKLRLLHCNKNLISKIDLSNNPELEDLCLRSNRLSSLDISHNPKILWFNCSFNSIDKIDLSQNHKLRQFILCNNGLVSIEGLSCLPNLELLHLSDNRLKALDVSNNYALCELVCFNNDLHNLDVSYNPNLSILACFGNPEFSTIYAHARQDFDILEKDDFTQIVYDSGLVFPDAAFRKYMTDNFDTNGDHSLSAVELNSVLEINVCTDFIQSLQGIEYCINLEKLTCIGSYDEEYAPNNYYGSLANLDLTQNVKLIYLSCAYNQIRSLDVSNNTNLEYLYCHNNPISDLDVSNNPNLVALYCRNCRLNELNVKYNLMLRELDCQGTNRISEIDISCNKYLGLLNANGIGLSTLNTNNNPKLSWLGCAGGLFETIDVSMNPELFCLSMDECRNVSVVDLSNNPEIKELYAMRCNNLQEIILKKDQVLSTLKIEEHTKITYK